MARMLPSPRMALGVLTGLNLLNYLDRFIPAAVLPAIVADLHLSGAQAGSMQLVFILSFAVISPAFGWLGDRRTRFSLAAIGVFVWSAATVGSGLATTFAVLLVARALTAVGEASYTVVTPSLISDFYPVDRRGRALALFYAAIPIGSAVGFMIGGAINAHWGWRAAFFVAGAPGAALAAVLLMFRDPVRGTFDAVKARGPRTARDTLAALKARPSYVYNTVAQILYTFAVGGLAFWMPTYFVEVRRLPLEVASRNFGIVLVLAGFAGTLIGGRGGDALARRRPDGHFLLSGVAFVASLPFTLLAVLHPSPAIFWPAMFMTLLLFFINTGPLTAAMANVLPPDLRASGIAVNTMGIHILGDAPSPLLIGLIKDHIGLATPVLVTGLLVVVAGLVLLAGRAALSRDLRAAAAVPA
jgi:MFS transporter, Spinster family, sphingosine-1-phosphate transporter